MKRSIYLSIAAAVAAAALISCQKEQAEAPSVNGGKKVKIIAESIETKLAFGEKDGTTIPVLWKEGDQVKSNVNISVEKEPVTVTPISGGTSAYYTVTIPDGVSAPYTFTALVPASAWVSTSNNNTYGDYVQYAVPTVQTPGDGQPDPAAMIAIAQSDPYAEAPDEVTLNFHNFVAYGRLTLKNLDIEGKDIQNIAIDFGKAVAGRYVYKLSTKEAVLNGTAQEITLKTSKTEDLLFGIGPEDVSGSTITVTVTVPDGKYVKSVTAPAGCQFKAGVISNFSVDMSGTTFEKAKVYTLVTDASALAAGKQVIIATVGSFDTDNIKGHAAISTSLNTNNRQAIGIEEWLDGNMIVNPGGSVEVFTLEESTIAGTWFLKTASAGAYIGRATSGNEKNYLRDFTDVSTNANKAACSWTITIDDAKTGDATIKSNRTQTTRVYLRANISGTSYIFSCYEAGKQSPVCMYMYDADAVPPVPAIDLSAAGTANSYITPPGKKVSFNASVKGNSTESVGSPAGAKLVWQDKAGLVSGIGYSDGKITLTTGDLSGNAVVAVTDDSDEILWSWHLWVTDYDPSASLYTTAANASGTVWKFMDRNLGALSTDHDYSSHGLIYQWGRKDPFTAAGDITEQNADYTYINDGEVTRYDIEGNALPTFYSLAEGNGTIAKSIAHPDVFYKVYSVDTGTVDEYGEPVKRDVPASRDWHDASDDDMWGGVSLSKTIYDPCPAGYKVPVCDADGNTPYAWLVYASMSWDTTNQGAVQDGQWFPACGTRVNFSGGNDHPGNYGGMWIGTHGKASSDLAANPILYGQYMFIINGKRTYKVNKDTRSQGLSVRCVAE